MKFLRIGIIRALCAIAVGSLLLYYPEDSLRWLTILIGILFFIPGLFSLIAYMVEVKRYKPETIVDAQGNVISGGKPTFPIVAIGSIALGLVLMLMPNSFVHLLVYGLAIILILGGIGQIMTLFTVKRIDNVSWSWVILPTIILLTGILMLLKPDSIAVAPLVVIGILCITYGIFEIIFSIMYYHSDRKYRKKQEEDIEDAEIIEEIEGSEPQERSESSEIIVKNE